MSIDINKHTPLPWVKDYGLTKGHIKSVGANEMNRTPTVCTYSKLPFSISEEEAEANAAFIVTACNNYDKLIEALKTFCDLRKADSDNDFNEAYHSAKELLQSIEKETL